MNRHELDVTSLVAGVVFALVGAAYLIDAGDVVDVEWRWAWPVLLLLLGAAGVAAALRPDDGGD